MAISSLVFFSILTLASGSVYYFYALNAYGVILSLAITAILSWKLIPFFKGEEDEVEKSASGPYSKTYFVFAAAYLILFFSCAYILFTNSTAKAIISPWQIVPEYFFLVYFLASLTLIFIAAKFKNTGRPIFRALLFFHYLLSFSIALVVYKTGYGFDPFIHEAALKVIDAKGIIEPKTFYYSGFYGLIIVLHKLLFIPLAWLNKFLVPVLGALLLPWAGKRVFKKLGWPDTSGLIILTLLILPFSFLIQSTPQNLAFLLAVPTILFSLIAEENLDYYLLILLSFVIFIIHPLAGIPFISFSIINLIYNKEEMLFGLLGKRIAGIFIPLKKYLYFSYFAACSIVLPLAFYFLEKGSKNPIDAPVSESPNFLSSIINSLKFTLPNKENLFLNFPYFIGQNGAKLLLILALLGIIITIKQKLKNYKIYLYFFLALIVSYFLTDTLAFGYLINYERSAYSDRIFFLSMLFLLPFMLLALQWYAKKLISSKGIFLYSNLVFFAVLLTSSLYLSYPRYDAFFNSRGYSTGNFDIEAVTWVENDAKDKFIVLANQQVSAGALHEFGFKHYYRAKSGEEIFNYPIPTGGKLYQYYLAMVYDKPTRVRMEKAMNLADVQTGYFVLNKYWNDYQKILEEAKLSADSYKSIGEGEVIIFKYSK